MSPTDEDEYERKRQEKEWMEPLDFSPSSGAVGSEQKSYDESTDSVRIETKNHTQWKDSEAPDVGHWVFGEYVNKWQWLKRLNSTEDANERPQQNNARGRYRDFQILADEVDDLTKREERELCDRVIELTNQLMNNTEEGLRFGGNRPIEVIEISLLTVAARSMIHVETFDEIDEHNPIHDIAFDGERVEHLCNIWHPKETQFSIDTVRELRSKITQRLKEADDE